MRLLSEPLLHFLLIGAAMFGLYGWLNHGKAQGDALHVVHITAQEVDWLKTIWTRQWQRPPTDSELKGVLAEYIREELLSREARALQLDVDDTVVRRVLAQKMEFLVNNSMQLPQPAEADVREYYQAHRARYRQPPRVTFSQDNALFPNDMTGDQVEIAKIFGSEFARQVIALEPGHWTVSSSFGAINVHVTERQPGRVPELAEIHDTILDDWKSEQQQAADKEYIAVLLKKYDLVVDESVKPLLTEVTL